jgi:hypothetical protein
MRVWRFVVAALSEIEEWDRGEESEVRQKTANSWIARILLRNRAELRSCITPPIVESLYRNCRPVLPNGSNKSRSWSQRGAFMPIVDRIVPIARFKLCIEYSVAGRGWGKIVTGLVDWFNNVQHPLSKEARTEVPILGQDL